MTGSEASAARFLAMRSRKVQGCRRGSSQVARPRRTSRRIVLDLAEPTLRLIHDVLIDAIHANVDFGDRGALLMVAEQMVAVALGVPPCDDPPLTDRNTP